MARDKHRTNWKTIQNVKPLLEEWWQKNCKERSSKSLREGGKPEWESTIVRPSPSHDCADLRFWFPAFLVVSPEDGQSWSPAMSTEMTERASTGAEEKLGYEKWIDVFHQLLRERDNMLGKHFPYLKMLTIYAVGWNGCLVSQNRQFSLHSTPEKLHLWIEISKHLGEGSVKHCENCLTQVSSLNVNHAFSACPVSPGVKWEKTYMV